MIVITTAGNTIFHPEFEKHFIAEIATNTQCYLAGEHFTQRGGIITMNTPLEVGQLIHAKP